MLTVILLMGVLSTDSILLTSMLSTDSILLTSVLCADCHTADKRAECSHTVDKGAEY